MGIFDFLKRKPDKNIVEDESFKKYAERVIAESVREDFLGKAALVGQKARAAKKDGDYHTAWGLYHEMKSLYLQHANKYGFTSAQTLALDASTSRPLANILRLEDRHHDALAHIVYWFSALEEPKAAQQKKLLAYYNRCKFRNLNKSDFQEKVEIFRHAPDFVYIRNTVNDWKKAEEENHE